MKTTRLGRFVLLVIAVLSAFVLVAPTASADVRSGVVIEYSGVSDHPFMLVDPNGGSHTDSSPIYLYLGDSYKVPSKYTDTLTVQIIGTSWKQRWDGASYGSCHSTGQDFASSWFKPNHDIRHTVRFLAYSGDPGCHHF